MAASTLVLPAVPVTPPSYHRIVSSSLTIPSNKELPIPVGLLACQRDPLLRTISTSVISCHVQSAPLADNGKKKKGNPTASTTKIYEVVLHDTVLFPEGGGQPSDTGILQAASGEQWAVVEVRRKGGHAVHFVRGNGDEQLKLVHGEHVTAALDESGWNRRLDHMCMHTSQHLLSALLETHLQLPTLSWALTTYPTPSYVELPRALTLDEIERIHAMAHRLAYEGRAVHIEVEPLEDNNRPGVATIETGRTVGKALPQDYTGGVKRTVIIDGVDSNPCCGTHLPSLSNLQLFILPQTESLNRGAMSTSRLFFLCGPRLHAHLILSHNLLVRTSGIMTCGTTDVPDRVTLVVEDRKKLEKRAEELEYELAKIVALELLKPTTAQDDTSVKKHYHRTDDPSRALGFLQSIAFACQNPNSETMNETRYCLVLTSSPPSQMNTSFTTVLVVSSDAGNSVVVGNALKAQLGVRGGGKGTRWSGKWTGVWKEGKEGKAIDDILSTI